MKRPQAHFVRGQRGAHPCLRAALTCATRPSAGLAKLRAKAYDAAILAVMLPEMDGFKLCRTIRKESDIPIIMLTAHGEVMDRVVGLAIGADDYVPKPFEPHELLARLQTILRRARAPAAPNRMDFEGLAIDVDLVESERLASGLPLLALDRTRIRLLLRNLLDNALRHSVGVTRPPVVSTVLEGSFVRLSVRDHGPGVAEDQLASLAQAFYRPDAARQRATGGVGLGLYLCRLVVRAHGRRMAMRNASPGLEVDITLPTA